MANGQIPENIYSEILFYAIQPSQKGFLWANQTKSLSYTSSWKDLLTHRWAQRIPVILVVPHLTFKCALTLEVSHVFEPFLFFEPVLHGPESQNDESYMTFQLFRRILELQK